MLRKKFLIVDDDERFAILVAKKLEDKANCVISLTGEDAALQFEHHLREKAPFSAVFMDINMPKMDGHEVVKKIRKIEKINEVAPLQAVKLVMLTSHADVTNVSKAFFKGSADAYIHKEEFGEKFMTELEKLSLI